MTRLAGWYARLGKGGRMKSSAASVMSKWLCWFGFHAYVIDPSEFNAWGGTETCRRCGKAQLWSNTYD